MGQHRNGKADDNRAPAWEFGQIELTVSTGDLYARRANAHDEIMHRSVCGSDRQTDRELTLKSVALILGTMLLVLVQ